MKTPRNWLLLALALGAMPAHAELQRVCWDFGTGHRSSSCDALAGDKRVPCVLADLAAHCPSLGPLTNADFLPWLYRQPDAYSLLKTVIGGLEQEVLSVIRRYKADHAERAL